MSRRPGALRARPFVLCALALWCTLLAAIPSRVQAAGVTVSTFYPITKQAYDACCPKGYGPPRIDAYPAGATAVAFYLRYAGAGASSQFAIVVRRHNGATIDMGGSWPLPSKYKEEYVVLRLANSAPWPSGSYDADLLINSNILMATIPFTVGAGGAVSGDGGAAAGGPSISTFYATTQQALRAWVLGPNNAPDPAATTAFTGGTATVAFYFRYKGVQAKVTKWQIVVVGPAGLKIPYGPYTLGYAAGRQGGYVAAPQHFAYPNGAYTAYIYLDTQPVAQTKFSVGAA